MRKRDGACPEHGDNCPYISAGTTRSEKPLPRIKASDLAEPGHRVDPDIIRGIERASMRLSDWDAAFAAGQRAERVRIHQLALTEAQRIRSANFSDLDGTWAGTLEDFAELLGQPDTATIPNRQEAP